jgi:hypothetical protein
VLTLASWLVVLPGAAFGSCEGFMAQASCNPQSKVMLSDRKMHFMP